MSTVPSRFNISCGAGAARHRENNHPYPRALRLISSGIRRLNGVHGKPAAYHDTITVAWARKIRALIDRGPLWLHSRAFIDAHPELVATDPMEPLLQHYSRALLTSAAARAAFVEPDVAPLPELQ